MSSKGQPDKCLFQVFLQERVVRAKSGPAPWAAEATVEKNAVVAVTHWRHALQH